MTQVVDPAAKDRRTVVQKLRDRLKVSRRDTPVDADAPKTSNDPNPIYGRSGPFESVVAEAPERVQDLKDKWKSDVLADVNDAIGNSAPTHTISHPDGPIHFHRKDEFVSWRQQHKGATVAGGTFYLPEYHHDKVARAMETVSLRPGRGVYQTVLKHMHKHHHLASDYEQSDAATHVWKKTFGDKLHHHEASGRFLVPKEGSHIDDHPMLEESAMTHAATVQERLAKRIAEATPAQDLGTPGMRDVAGHGLRGPKDYEIVPAAVAPQATAPAPGNVGLVKEIEDLAAHFGKRGMSRTAAAILAAIPQCHLEGGV